MDLKIFMGNGFLTSEEVNNLAVKSATILDEGKINENTSFGRNVFEINIELSNGEKRAYTMNKTSICNVAKEFGDDSKKWIGQKINFDVVQQKVKGEIKDVVYSHPAKTKEDFI
jgi:hypothetical protein